MNESGDVKSAWRTLQILGTVSERGATSVPELANLLGFPRSSLHGLLNTMTRAGWLESDGNGHITLGLRAWEVGRRYTRARDLARLAEPIMATAVSHLNETVQLAVLDGRYNVYVAKVNSSQALALVSEVGTRLEAHATGVGKVLLAFLSDAEFDQLFDGVTLERFTDATICTPERLRAEMAQIRKRGYGFDCEERTIGVRCIAFPIFVDKGQAKAALSVSIPTPRLTDETEQAVISVLSSSARDLSDLLRAMQG